MIDARADLLRVLQTVATDDTGGVWLVLHRMLDRPDLVIHRGSGTVTAASLASIYERRAANPRLPAPLANQCAALARTAASHHSELWRMYEVKADHDELVVWTTLDGAGRFALHTHRDPAPGAPPG